MMRMKIRRATVFANVIFFLSLLLLAAVGAWYVQEGTAASGAIPAPTGSACIPRRQTAAS